jgi:DNA helicase-2/ATP-dependent DNA helicase PcrA
VNYRCPEPVVTAARTLLSYNHRRVPKEIRPGPSADAAPEAFRVRLDPAAGGATALVEEVRQWLSEPGVEPSDIAVLARVNSLLLAPHVALAEAGVPIDSVLRTDVLNRTGLRAALAYLRIAVDPNAIQPDDLAEVYRRPSRGMPNWITKWFRGASSISRVRAIATRLDDEKVAMKVEQLADDLALVVAAASDGTTRSVLTAIQVDVGLGAAMELLDRSKGGEGSTQLDDLEALLQVADLHPDAASFEPWLRSVFHREAEGGGVALSTIHRVKGREWPRVALFGASAGLLPHRLSVDVEEERRVLHVGITRGRDRVVVLADANRPSPFLAELDGSAAHRPAGQPDPAANRTAAAAPARAIRSSSAPAEPLSGPAAVIDDALRTWRRERSKADGVAAFIVASNATLAAIARAKPTSMAELARIPGIGPAKLDLYGDEILAILEDMP